MEHAHPGWQTPRGGIAPVPCGEWLRDAGQPSTPLLPRGRHSDGGLYLPLPRIQKSQSGEDGPVGKPGRPYPPRPEVVTEGKSSHLPAFFPQNPEPYQM